MIVETHFTSNTNFKLYGFTNHLTNHPDNTAHASSSIVVSSKIHHYLLPLFHEQEIQATNMQININSISITLSSIYCPPNHNINHEQLNSLFNSLGNAFVTGNW
jgi:hypothetical protein